MEKTEGVKEMRTLLIVAAIAMLSATGCTSTGEPYYTGKITGGSVQNHWGYRKNRQLARRIYRGERRARGRR